MAGIAESRQIRSKCCISTSTACALPISSSLGTHVLSRYSLHFPETGTHRRHLINSHLTDSSRRPPVLREGLSYCSCRFLLRLRHQHSLRAREAQHSGDRPLSALTWWSCCCRALFSVTIAT